MPQVTLSIDEFVAEHGGPAMRIDSDVWLLADGAQYAKNYTPGSQPIQYPPPDDGLARLKSIRTYWRKRVEVVEDAFRKLKLSLLSQGFDRVVWQPHWGEVPQGDDVAQLKALAAAARREKETLKAVEQEFDQLPQVQAQRQREASLRQAEEQRARAEQERRRKIDAITI